MTEINRVLFEKISKIPLFSAEATVDFISNETNIDKNLFNIDSSGNIIYKKDDARTLYLFRISPFAIYINDYVVSSTDDEELKKLEDKECFLQEKFIGKLIKKEDKIILNPNCNIENKKIYNLDVRIKCKGNKLYSNYISSQAIIFLIINLLKETNGNIAFGLTNQFLSGLVGAVEVVKESNFTNVLVVTTSKEEETCKKDKGCAIVIKDGNCLASPKIYNKLMEFSDQLFLGKKDNVLEKISIISKDMQVGGVYLPLVKDESSHILCKDIEKTCNLLLKSTAVL